MNHQGFRPGFTRWENHLLGLSSLVAVISLICIPYTPGPKLINVPEVIIPLGLSLALSLYTVRLQWRNQQPSQVKPMVKYGWAGALVSAVIGGSWTALHLHYGLPIDVLPDKILTILSVGIVAGVFIGRGTSGQQNDRPTDGVHIVSETSWTNRSEPSPIVGAIIDAIVELEGADPLDLEPLYHDMDPDVLSALRSQDDSQWQLLFQTAEYEVRVSSHGTVTVYSDDLQTATSPTVSTR